MRAPLRLLTLAPLALLLLPGAAAARSYRETASYQGVSATLTYTATTSHYSTRFSRSHLTIRRNGRLQVSQYLRVGAGDSASYPSQPAEFFAHRSSLSIRHLDAARDPQVIVDLFTGGAHCCYVTQVFAYRPGRGRYDRVQQNFLDAGATLENVDHRGVPEFVSADARFAYAFTSFAASAFPLRILRFTGRRFAAVTDQFPALVRRDARQWLSSAGKAARLGDARGVLAAYAADEATLGDAPDALARISAIARAKHLGRYAKPGGEAYVRALKRLLRKLGYPLDRRALAL